MSGCRPKAEPIQPKDRCRMVGLGEGGVRWVGRRRKNKVRENQSACKERTKGTIATRIVCKIVKYGCTPCIHVCYAQRQRANVVAPPILVILVGWECQTFSAHGSRGTLYIPYSRYSNTNSTQEQDLNHSDLQPTTKITVFVRFSAFALYHDSWYQRIQIPLLCRTYVFWRADLRPHFS